MNDFSSGWKIFKVSPVEVIEGRIKFIRYNNKMTPLNKIENKIIPHKKILKN